MDIKNHFRLIAIKAIKPGGLTDEQLRIVSSIQKRTSDYGWLYFHSGYKLEDDEVNRQYGNKLIVDVHASDDTGLFSSNSNMNINVTAIVGSNGSGKSSTVDLLIRVINNLGVAWFGEDANNEVSEHLFFIENLYASLVYAVGNNYHSVTVCGRSVKVSNYQFQEEIDGAKVYMHEDTNELLLEREREEGGLIHRDAIDRRQLKDYREFIPRPNGQPYSDTTYNSVLKKRHTYTCMDDVDRLSVWRRVPGAPKVSESIDDFQRNHFDLDHVLPKSVCPIVGLSLFNFVPSCQVCNEKLKGQRTLGSNENIRQELSPTDHKYSFRAKFVLENITGGIDKLRYEDHPNDYILNIKPEIGANTKEMINLFHLKTRYNFHKKEVLRLMDLLHDYDDDHLRMIHSQLLLVDKNTPYTIEKMRSDIFRETSLRERDEVMYRMKLDIINNYRKKH